MTKILEYPTSGLSSTAVAELLAKGFDKPSQLIDGSITEARMKRELTEPTFREIQVVRRLS
ncbi:hypothetical protein GCM10007881_55270 [Mesorhizobium huakuii]|uniref:hypothetical protein n=1 Tax=Mesorhizobium huakuii TaxID=28104 RepID=UPI00235BBBD3|nr:hypothetical protein [Mesorhizobium huakuii]GLQ82006.1 hypothetical protein GCM10007881_55270 [Mesorhizobium huakuii]